MKLSVGPNVLIMLQIEIKAGQDSKHFHYLKDAERHQYVLYNF